MKKSSFIIHIDSLGVLDELTDEQVGQLFRAMKSYHEGIEINLNGFAKVAFIAFKNQFVRDEESYKRRSEANKINGSKGGKRKVANASESKRKVANASDLNSKSDSKSDSKNESKSGIGDLRHQLNSFKSSNPDKYSNTMYEAFERYWSEPLVKGRLKGCQRWEDEKTWEIGRRLANWHSRDNGKYSQPKGTFVF